MPLLVLARWRAALQALRPVLASRGDSASSDDGGTGRAGEGDSSTNNGVWEDGSCGDGVVGSGAQRGLMGSGSGRELSAELQGSGRAAATLDGRRRLAGCCACPVQRLGVPAAGNGGWRPGSSGSPTVKARSQAHASRCQQMPGRTASPCHSANVVSLQSCRLGSRDGARQRANLVGCQPAASRGQGWAGTGREEESGGRIDLAVAAVWEAVQSATSRASALPAPTPARAA